jgi:SulP family sulfate permease
MTGKPLNSDQELIAQGIGNIILPFFGGIPATAAIARTSVAIKSGAQTRLTGIFHAVVLLISMFLLAPVMSAIPLSALAGVLLVTAWRMNEWEAIKYIFSRRFKGAILKYGVTLLATVFFDLTVAIIIGVLVALVLLVKRLSSIEINYEMVDMSRIGVSNDALRNRYRHSCVVYITGPLIFANSHEIQNIPANLGSDCDTAIFSMRGASHMDISGAQILLEVIQGLREKGIDVVLCGLPKSTMKMIERSGIAEILGEGSFYWSVERVLLENRPYFNTQKVC